ncbi:hypothetical protein HNQ69_001291 [Bartonella callosciuri]|uniref:Uncharacterized protein n=1 Tax=Bartonella callosciuri TaxID=686223 RepID=A0A840NSW2_9HYPH|nr:hypothetical protein [Bartonella callosciuri]MBB5074154.1 hypothetical protein [Bartonella callosciuri]
MPGNCVRLGAEVIADGAQNSQWLQAFGVNVHL